MLVDALGERLVPLQSGALVNYATLDCLLTLQARGHVVSLDDVGDLDVRPPCCADAMVILETNCDDVVAILQDLDDHPTAVH